MMKVEIWSDVACPFCYIGKRHFEQALSQFAHKDDISVQWHSFQLDPEFEGKPGQNIHEVLAAKKGWTADYARKMNDYVTDMARQAGLTYHFDKLVPANTFRAHRFSHLAAAKGKQDAAEERLFAAYFTEGKNIDDPETLEALGEDLGIPASETASALASDAYTSQVLKDISEAQAIGIHGVPFFVFDRKYAVSGAQPVDVFAGALQQAWEEWHKTQPGLIHIGSGPVCDEDGCAIPGKE